MPLSYEESANLMCDATFVSRVKVACLKYAAYISDEATNTPAHASRLRWAQTVQSNPDSAAMQVVPAVVMDASVQDGGANIPDEALQSAVETTLNKQM
jgi:hypothetical protein